VNIDPVTALRARRPAAARPGRRAARTIAFVALSALAAWAAPLHAEKADREKPVNYSADSGDVNYQTKVGTLTGNVVVTQGTMTIHADRIVIRQNPDNSVSVSATGNPITFRQKRDGVDEYFDGYAQRAEYDGSKEQLELFDRAILRRGQDEIRSNYISYNTATEMFKAEGRAGSPTAPTEGSPGTRVRGVFQPKSEATAKDAAKGGAKGAPKDAAKDAPTGPPVALTPAPDIAAPAAK
jgi:lipopolysaccharide export system protein LptA